MSSASSNRKTSTANGCVCFCMQPAVVLTSRTKANPGRHFFRCPYHNIASMDCKFFKWKDASKRDIKPSRDEVHFKVDDITKLRADIEELQVDFESLIHCVCQLKENSTRRENSTRCD